jgi:hypothetical protein
MEQGYRVVSDHDGIKGWSEELLYGGEQRTYALRRQAEDVVRELQKRTQRLWPHERIGYRVV